MKNVACRDQIGDLFLWVFLLGWGAVAGNMGSLVRIQSIGHPNLGTRLDSLLGATLQ